MTPAMTDRRSCKKGHLLTPDNVRRRSGERAGHRECLTCYRDDHAARDRRTAANDVEQNRIRNIRKQVDRSGLILSKQGVVVTVLDTAGTELVSGSIDEVERWAGDRFTGRRPGPRQPHKIPPAWMPWIEVFVAEMHAAKRRAGTAEKRIHHLMMFNRARPHLTPLTVTRDDLVRYLDDNRDWSPRTAHSFRSTFRVFFRLLAELGHRDDDPAATLPAVTIPRSSPRPCPDQAVRRAYALAQDDPRLRLALRIAVETGVRPFELAKLRGEDVEGWAGMHTLRVEGKGGHVRHIPINDDLASAITTAAGSGYLFPAPDGGHITCGHLSKLIAAALPDHWTAYNLRHRFATLSYQENCDLRATQELLGHASPTTTAIYTKVADQAMRRAASAAVLA